MRIGIFGRHPIPQPGFMGVMSLFEAKHFALLQNEVELLIPFPNRGALDRLLTSHRLSTLDDLAKFQANFEIVPIFVDEPLDRPRYDVIVYQSYDVADWKNFHPALRRHCRVLTKNFPKFVPGVHHAWHPSVEHQFKAFDVVACALRSDIDELRGDRRFWSRYGHRAVYVPRGADPRLLHPGRKLGGRPTIGIDMPGGEAGLESVQHYIEPIRRLRERIPELRVLSLGYPFEAVDAETIPFGRFDRIYDIFFNEIWVLLVMDYGRSKNHVRALVQSLHPDDWSRRAIYEVQNVEAQMAGAALLAHPTNVIDELIQPGSTGFYYTDHQDADDICNRLVHILGTYPQISLQARDWAVRNFNWSDCISCWHNALETAVSDAPFPH